MIIVEKTSGGCAPARANGADRFNAARPRFVAELTWLRGEVTRLQANARARDEWMAIVVHELLQPLTTLLVTTSHLARRAAGEDRPPLERLRDAGLRLAAMISDLSDTSSLESGTFTLHVVPTDIASLVTASVARLAPGVHVSVDGETPWLDVDPRRVEQVLANLLVNAQKYGSGRSLPSVAITQQGNDVVIAVTNEGLGVPRDERIRVFERRYRSPSRKPGTPGLGLGLYICKQLIEEHGGRIWADGDPIHARFSFSIPIREPASRVSETRIIADRVAHERWSTPPATGDAPASSGSR
jgi:signal transduction histidine kinase